MSTKKTINFLGDIENTIANMSNDELEQLAAETHDTLEAVMRELKKRRHENRHANIDSLEAHLNSADTSFKSLKDFIRMALKELKS